MEQILTLSQTHGVNLILFTVGTAFLIAYMVLRIRDWSRVNKKGGTIKENEEGVSVIITTHNCGEYLEKNLIYFLTQNYSKYEVIVVDECSDDRTAKVLEDLKEQYPHLKYTKIHSGTKFRHTKKIAINLGVLAAQYDILLFSEITARPLSKEWVRSMQYQFTEDTVGVVGYANFSRDKEFVDLNYLQGFINFIDLACQYGKKVFRLGNGYNMAYRKSAYLAKRGFTYNSQIYLGYDCDIVHILSGEGKIAIAKDPSTFVEIERNADRSCQDWFNYRWANIRQWSIKTKLLVWAPVVLKNISLLLFLFSIHSLTGIKFVFGAFFILFLFDFILLLSYLKRFEQTKLMLSTLISTTFGMLYTRYLSFGRSLFIGNKWR